MDIETIYDAMRQKRADIERESERLTTEAALCDAMEALLEENESLKSSNNEMAQDLALVNKQIDVLITKNEKLQAENDDLKSYVERLKSHPIIVNNFQPGSCTFQAGSSQNGNIL